MPKYFFNSWFQNPENFGVAIKLRGENKSEYHLMGDDELVNNAELEEQIEIAKICNLGNCIQIPSTNLMKIKANSFNSKIF